MKKNILVLSLLFFSSSLVCEENFIEQESVEEMCEENNDQHDANDQFGDFFGSSDDDLNQIVRPKKEPWSRARILMVRLGVATVLGVQGFYAWLSSAWAYITSWGACEERKA